MRFHNDIDAFVRFYVEIYLISTDLWKDAEIDYRVIVFEFSWLKFLNILSHSKRKLYYIAHFIRVFSATHRHIQQ